MYYYYPVQISGFWEQLGRNRNRTNRAIPLIPVYCVTLGHTFRPRKRTICSSHGKRWCPISSCVHSVTLQYQKTSHVFWPTALPAQYCSLGLCEPSNLNLGYSNTRPQPYCIADIMVNCSVSFCKTWTLSDPLKRVYGKFTVKEITRTSFGYKL